MPLHRESDRHSCLLCSLHHVDANGVLRYPGLCWMDTDTSLHVAGFTETARAVDKSKGKREIKEFNEYIIQQLKGKLNPSVPLSINHLDSREDAGLQAVDLFAWGILRKYEKKDFEWFNCYEEKVRIDELYLP